MRLFVLFSLVIFACSCKKNTTKVARENEQLSGSWQMIADQQVDSAGNVSRQDTMVSGLLIYTPEGKMSVQLLWKGTRNQIMSDSIMSQDGVSSGLGLGMNTWTPQQARTIIDTYDAYFGDYSVDWENHIVTHTITGNLRPEKQGRIYKRRFQIKGDTLFLRSIDPAVAWQVAWIKK